MKTYPAADYRSPMFRRVEKALCAAGAASTERLATLLGEDRLSVSLALQSMAEEFGRVEFHAGPGLWAAVDEVFDAVAA